MEEQQERLIHVLIIPSDFDFERILALQVIAEAMRDLTLRGHNIISKTRRVEARHFFFDPMQRPILNYWCERSNVNMNMVIRHAHTVYAHHHL
jgi:hypothetical protein